jgi:biopolymer transport protein ExbD
MDTGVRHGSIAAVASLGGLRTLAPTAMTTAMPFKHLVALTAFCLASYQNAGADAEQCSAPPAHWRKQSEGMGHHAIPIHVRLDAEGQAGWNGKTVMDSELAAYLDKARPMEPSPFVILSAQPETSCNRVEAMRRVLEQHYCQLRSVCGEGSGNSRDWDQGMDLRPTPELRQLEQKADAMSEAAERCVVPSAMDKIEGTSGTEPAHYRCRPIPPERR